MSETFRDTPQWYPILPSGSWDINYTPEAADIIDARVCVLLDCFELGTQTCIEAFITAVNNHEATITVYWRENGGKAKHKELIVPVFTGKNAYGSLKDRASNYVLLSSAVSFSGKKLRLHPDCLLLAQKPPKLDVWNRTKVYSDDGINGEPKAGPQYRQQRNCIDIDNGHNTQITYDETSGTITIQGGAGLGLGIYTEPPYVSGGSWEAAYETRPHVGLRTINGITEDVTITTGASVSALSADEDGKKDNIFLTIEALKSNEDKGTEA